MSVFNSSCKNDVRIVDLSKKNWDGKKFINDGPNFFHEARAILDYNEAIWLCQTKQNELHRPFMIHLQYEQISIVRLLQLVRKFVIHFDPIPEYVSLGTTVDDAKRMIKFMTEKHGFDISSVETGLLILSNNISFNFAKIFQDHNAYQGGLDRALVIIKSSTSPIFFVDDNLIKDYYSNKNVTQRETSLLDEIGFNDSSDDEVTEIDLFNETATHMMNTASEIMIANDGLRQQNLGKLLFEKTEDMKNRANRVVEQKKESEEEAKLEIQSLKNRIILYQETNKLAEDENNELTKEHIQKEEKMSQRISILQKSLAKTETANVEKSEEIMALADELVNLKIERNPTGPKLTAKNLAKRVKAEPDSWDQFSSSSDEYADFEQTYSLNTQCVPKASIFTVGTPDESKTNLHDKKNTFIGTPSKFGMKNWDEANNSLLEHLLSLEMGLAQAEAKGCSVKTQQNLILMTLPHNYEYVTDFLEEADRSSMDSFKKKLITLVMGTNTDQTSHFLQAQRKPDENILTYFRRLKALYLSCTKTTEVNLETDTMGQNMIYKKLEETMPQLAKIEFTRLCENTLNDGTFSLTKLKQNIVVANRKISKTPQILLNPVQDNPGPWRRRSPADTREHNGFGERPSPYRQETRICYHCDRPGHLVRNCFRRKKEISLQNINGREPKTPRGRTTNYQPRYRPLARGDNHNWRNGSTANGPKRPFVEDIQHRRETSRNRFNQ
jgi:hypothetical protein